MIYDAVYGGMILWLELSGLVVMVALVVSRLASFLAFRHAERELTANKTLIHEYSASSDLTPAEFGFIFDRKLRDNELLAVLIRLHQKHVVLLQNHKGDLIIRLRDTKKPPQNLDALELETISIISEQGGILPWREFAQTITAGNQPHKRLEHQVYSDLETKGYFEHGTRHETANRIRSFGAIMSAVLSIAFVAFPLSQAFQYSGLVLEAGYATIDRLGIGLLMGLIALFLWPIWYVYALFVMKILYHSSGLPLGATSKLKHEWRRAYGYRVFLYVVEKNRLETDPNLNDKALPWAVAVGAGPEASKLL